ncbi:hypothetical protein HH212_17235 [Massilia forsythiae]|uniref:Uncharacterized protein n=1 Tax=Massilia forsythiae TaxID=2728020 RepID=A0A7Z2ZTG3_9BURK|nr:hypothetical protein [Massilia forsythiae]QJE01556.1 hypothetical protein HH212_17235 [Massilia forsythiae]
MLHPLASLWRHAVRVTFYEAGGQAGHALFRHGDAGQAHAAGARRRFTSADAAFHYLRYWLGEPAASAELKWVLQRSGPSLVGTGGAEGWLHALAARLVGGAIVVLEEDSRRAMPGRLVAAPSAAMSAAAVAALPPLSAVAPAVAATPDLLPALEEVRIEGAQVLPELNQSLAQVESATASVAAAALSLDPAPSKVAAIRTALGDASTQAGADLGRL